MSLKNLFENILLLLFDKHFHIIFSIIIKSENVKPASDAIRGDMPVWIMAISLKSH